MSALLTGKKMAKKQTNQPIQNPQGRDRIDLRVDPDFYSQIEKAASRLHLSMSAYIRQAIVERLDKEKDARP